MEEQQEHKVNPTKSVLQRSFTEMAEKVIHDAVENTKDNGEVSRQHRMTEDNFVLGYLKLFLDMCKSPNDNSIKVRDEYITWMKNTNNGTKEVEIVDNADHNKVLYVVPPLVSSSIDLKKTADIPFYQIGKIASDLNNYVPGRGDAHMIDSLVRPILDAVDQRGNKNNEIWKEIFNRYSGKVYVPYDKTLTIPDYFEVQGNREAAAQPAANPTPTTLSVSKKKKHESTDDLW